MTMLLAGEDTTANTLAWMIWLPAPPSRRALARARAEVDRVAGDPAAWTPERFAALRYLEACANETMRLKPVAPSLTLQALRDTVVGDVRVPAGTLVWGALRSDSLEELLRARRRASTRALARAPTRRPARRRRTGSSMPFGAGPRVCPGRHLAMLEMKMALAMLLGALRDRERRHRRAAASPTSGCRSRWRPAADDAAARRRAR